MRWQALFFGGGHQTDTHTQAKLFSTVILTENTSRTLLVLIVYSLLKTNNNGTLHARTPLPNFYSQFFRRPGATSTPAGYPVSITASSRNAWRRGSESWVARAPGTPTDRCFYAVHRQGQSVSAGDDGRKPPWRQQLYRLLLVGINCFEGGIAVHGYITRCTLSDYGGALYSSDEYQMSRP